MRVDKLVPDLALIDEKDADPPFVAAKKTAKTGATKLIQSTRCNTTGLAAGQTNPLESDHGADQGEPAQGVALRFNGCTRQSRWTRALSSPAIKMKRFK